LMALIVGCQHPLDFGHQHRVAATGLLDERATLARRPIERRLEDLSHSLEIIGTQSAGTGGLMHARGSYLL
jgi:hypothetical protein